MSPTTLMARTTPATEITAPASSSGTREILRRLELEVTGRLDGLLHGDHRGLVPGHGTEQGETRTYAPGDDVRRIDWNVTARLQEAHIRQTIAERELQTWLLIDRSPRLNFGTTTSTKHQLALAAAGAFGFLTSRDGNQIGAVFAHPNEVIQPRGSRTHLLHILSKVAAPAPADGAGVTDLTAAIDRLAAVARRRGLVVVISDFWVAPGWESHLATLARRHDVVAVQLTDPREFELPNVGTITIRDPATGRDQMVATQKPKVRRLYAQKAQERQEAIAASLRSARVDHLVLATDRPWLDDLVLFTAARRRRLLALTGAAL